MKYLFYSLRPKQWIKNLFVFLPLIFGKKLFLYPNNLKVVFSFFLFSIASGIVYLVNDIIDYEKDKLHPTKRLRPIASGKISIKKAVIVAFLVAPIILIFSFVLNIKFGILVIFYLLFNQLYSKVLKDAVILDIFCISAFFLLRIFAGGIIAEVDLSHWIIFMVALLALFLGFNKRRHELKILEKRAHEHRFVLKKYSPYFIDQMVSIITSSIVVVYMLYTVDARTITEFGTDHLIYSIPFVYYGIFRYLYLIHKIRKEGDPTRVLLSDFKLRLDIVLWLLVCVAVIYFKI